MNNRILLFDFVRPFLALVALCLAQGIPAKAQADFTDERLDGLELEYVGKDLSGGKASVYLDLTYFNLFASHQKGWNGGDGVYSTTLPDRKSVV